MDDDYANPISRVANKYNDPLYLTTTLARRAVLVTLYRVCRGGAEL